MSSFRKEIEAERRWDENRKKALGALLIASTLSTRDELNLNKLGTGNDSYLWISVVVVLVFWIFAEIGHIKRRPFFKKD